MEIIDRAVTDAARERTAGRDPPVAGLVLGPYEGAPTARADWRLVPQLLIFAAFEILARATGKPWPRQRALFDLGGVGWWLASTAFLIVCFPPLVVAASHVPDAGFWNVALLPLVFVLQVILVGRLRVQQVTFGHHAVHGALSKRWPRLNKVVAAFATIVSLAQNPSDYQADHVGKHHRFKYFTSIQDPDAEFLYALGFRPGMSRGHLYKNLLLTILSPRFHGLFLKARVRSTFVTSSATHRAFAAIWLAALLSLSLVIPWWAYLAAVIMTWGPLYHVSALLQFLTEHRWTMERQGPADKREYAARCVGRFSLLPPPAGHRGLAATAAWASWCVRMVPETLVRLGAWVGDLPAHDHHHLVGHIGHDPEDWHEAIFERQRSIDEGDPSGLATREVYGLRAALDWVFDGLSNSRG